MATLEASGIAGAAPRWKVPGTKHVPEIAPTTLKGGLGAFYANGGNAGGAGAGIVEPLDRGKRHFREAPTDVQREPQIANGNVMSGYHLRLAGGGGDYRRHNGHVEPQLPPDRAEGRRKLEPAEAKYPVDRRRHVDQPVSAVYAPEPAMPRLFRPEQHFAVREDAREIALEQMMTRKVRAPEGQEAITQARASKMRVEILDWDYSHKTVDTPTFQRFVTTLAPPTQESAVDRRMRATTRTHEAEKQAERDLVRSLDDWEPPAPKDAPPEQEKPKGKKK